MRVTDRQQFELALVNEAQERCYDVSSSKGFHSTDTFHDAVWGVLERHDEYNDNDSIPSPETNQVVEMIIDGLAGEWEQMQHAKRLLLIVGELIEAFEEIRAGHAPTEVYEKDGKPEGVPVELADVQIRLWDLAQTMGISLQTEVQRKEAFNRTREFMHGKQF